MENSRCIMVDADKLIALVHGLEQAYLRAYDATYQGHSEHWDKTGQGGAGCPACKKAQEGRNAADDIFTAALGRAPGCWREPLGYETRLA